MAGDPRVLELLEEMLGEGKSPEEVCRVCPELLPEVRERWKDFQLIDEAVGDLLPGLRTPAGNPQQPPKRNTVPAGEMPVQLMQYRILDRLGTGGMGDVYLAEHTLLGRRCAVKVIRSRPSGEERGLQRFEREVRAIATLTHPNTVQVYDYGRADDGTFFYAMEYLPGLTLDRLCEQYGPLPPQRAIYLLRQVCGALREAHGIGLVHRDVKPANVIVCERGGLCDVVKLLDFGLVRAVGAAAGEKLTRDGTIAGTPAYMSPEQAEGELELDGRSDIYSLGAMAYFLLTGRPPFVKEMALQLLFAHTREQVRPLTHFRADLPADLEAVVLRCLEKDRELRFADAGALDEALMSCQQGEPWTEEQAAGWWRAHVLSGPPRGDEKSPPKVPAAPAADAAAAGAMPAPAVDPKKTSGFQPLPKGAAPVMPWSGTPDRASTPTKVAAKHTTVGRQKELAELYRAFQSVADGQGHFLCVTGEPGMGKSTLVDVFLSELKADNRSFALARGRCSERLAGTEAYLPLLDALESLLQGGEGETVVQAMKAIAPNWYAQVASQPADDSSLVRALADSKAATQERLKRELVAFVQEVSRQRPLILFFDDLHWADASTVDLLAYLGGKCAGMRVLLLLTYRPTDLVLSKHPFGPVKLDLQARGVCRELALEFLTRPDLDRYLGAEFPEHAFPEEFATLVHERTEGSPLFMADLLRYLRDRQVLTQEQGRWTLGKSVPDLRHDLPESVRGMIQRKIEQLNEEDRRLLVAASVQGYEFDSAVVAQVLECDAAEVEDRLDELDRVHAFVRLLGEQEFPGRTLTLRYRFVHVLYQNTLYASLRPTRRAALSAAVAQSLLGFYGDKCTSAAAELALLWEAARDFERAADFFLAAAQNAARFFANHEAVALARRGIDLLASLPDTPQRARKELALQITLGPALFSTKDWRAPDVQEAYTRAHVLCRQLGESPDQFPAMWGLFLFHIASGEIQPALKLGEQLLNLAQRAEDPALLLQANHALGPTYALVGDWAAARSHLEEAIAYYDPEAHRSHALLYGGHDPCVCCLGFAAQSLWMLGYPDQALQKGQAALVQARALGQPASLAHTQLLVAILLQFLRNVGETQKLAEDMQGYAAEQGLVFYLSGGLALRGWALAAQGFSEEGIAQIRQGRDAGGAMRAHWSAYSLALWAEACGNAGRVEEGLAVVAEALDVVEETGIHIYEPELYRLRGEFLLALDPQSSVEAEACFRQAIDLARRDQAKSLELRAAMSLARLWQRQGRRSEARAAVAAVYGTFTEGFATPDLLDARELLESLA